MAKVTVTLTGDEARLLRALDRVAAKEREVGRRSAEAATKSAKGAERVARATRKVGKAKDQAFGTKSIGQLARFAAGLGAIATAGSAVASVLRNANEMVERMAAKQRESELRLRSLAQLAQGDKGKLRQLTDQSRNLFAGGGAQTLEQAAAVIFQLESAGINDRQTRQTFTQLYGVIDDPVSFARAARTIQAALGKKETGSIRSILSKAFAASSASPAQAPALLEGASRGAAYAKSLGLGDEDILSATAITATTSGSAELGGTQVSSLLRQLGRAKDKGLRGEIRSQGSLGGILDLLQRKGLTGQDAFAEQFGKRAEAFVALQALVGNRGLFDRTRASQFEASRADLTGMIAGSADADLSVRLARQRRIAEARTEIAGTRVGNRRQFVEGLIQRQEAQLFSQDKTGTAAAVRFWRTVGLSPLGQITGFGATDKDVIEQARSEGALTPRDEATLLELNAAAPSPAAPARKSQGGGEFDGLIPRERSSAVDLLQRINTSMLNVVGNTAGSTLFRSPDEDK